MCIALDNTLIYVTLWSERRPATKKVRQELALTDEDSSGISSSSSISSTSNSCGHSDSDTRSSRAADERVQRLEAKLAVMQHMLENQNKTNTPASQSDVMEVLWQRQQQQQQAAMTTFMQQMTMMKEMMTLMAPPAQAPVYSHTPHLQPTSLAPPKPENTYSLETIERIAKMFK